MHHASESKRLKAPAFQHLFHGLKSRSTEKGSAPLRLLEIPTIQRALMNL
jgi:hypothetical protein